MRKSPRPCLRALPAYDLNTTANEPRIKSPLATPALPFASSKSVALLSPHVHFPPTPSLISTHQTHSPNTYDRAPIMVSPNGCALPERGDRVFGRPPTPIRSYFSPHASSACETEGLEEEEENHYWETETVLQTAPAESFPPELTFSSSESSSDDSDVCYSPPASAPVHSSHRVGIFGEDVPAILPSKRSQEDLKAALTFLPHPSPKTEPPKKPRSKRPQRPPLRSRPPSFCSSFTADGCLGGF